MEVERFKHRQMESVGAAAGLQLAPAVVSSGTGASSKVMARRESASRLLIILVIMTMQFGWINAFNKMCAGLINVNTQRKALIFL
jgi:hypothetical protein